MIEIRYNDHNYIISESRDRLVYLVSDPTGKRRWLRVYDRGLALAVRDDYDNRQAQHEMSEMDEAASTAHWAELGYL